MTFTRWFFKQDENFEYNTGLWDYDDDRIMLKKKNNDISVITYKKHLVGAFWKFKEVTRHPTKTNEANAVFDGIKLLWGKHLKRGQYTLGKKRHWGYKVASLRALQKELTLRFRDTVILKILQDEHTKSTPKPNPRLPFVNPFV